MTSTTTEETWTEADDLHLASSLACLSRLSDYEVVSEWQAEMGGEHNEFRLYGTTVPGVEVGSEDWRILCNWRTWWLFLRNDTGISLDEAAEEIGVNPGTISRWERGQRDPTGEKGEAYKAWLAGQHSQLIAGYRDRVFTLAGRRDRWPYQPTGEELDAIWREFWRAGGWADQWRRTGVLPNTNRLDLES